MSPVTRRTMKWEVAALRQEYLHVRNRSELQINFVTNADCIAAAAFGRNFFSDEELNARINVFTRNNTLPDTEVFRYMAEQGFDPDEGNSKLARAVKYVALLTTALRGVPMFLQWEVSYALYLFEREFWDQAYKRNRIVSLYPKTDDDAYRTYHVVRDVRYQMHIRQLSQPLVIALPPMLPRAIATFWKYGVNTVVAPDSFYGTEYSQASNWDPQSLQSHTRSMQAFKNRERIARLGSLLPFRLGPFGHCSLTPPKQSSTRRESLNRNAPGIYSSGVFFWSFLFGGVRSLKFSSKSSK